MSERLDPNLYSIVAAGADTALEVLTDPNSSPDERAAAADGIREFAKLFKKTWEGWWELNIEYRQLLTELGRRRGVSTAGDLTTPDVGKLRFTEITFNLDLENETGDFSRE